MIWPRTIALDNRIILQDYDSGYCVAVSTKGDIKPFKIKQESLILEGCSKYVFHRASIGWLLSDFDDNNTEGERICGPDVTDFALSPLLKTVIWRRKDVGFRLANLRRGEEIPIESGELNVAESAEYFFLDE